MTDREKIARLVGVDSDTPDYYMADQLLALFNEEETLCSRLSECGYSNCSHRKAHAKSEELCRQFSTNPCPCRSSLNEEEIRGQSRHLASLRLAVKQEGERIIDYLAYWWRSHSENELTGDSRQTFLLPEDWKEAIRKGKPPYKPEDWQSLEGK